MLTNIICSLFHSREILTELGEQTTASNNDDDIQIMSGQQDASLKCPITTALLEEPMKNKVCGHVYSKPGILQMIGRVRQCKCPVPGCGNNRVTVDQLEPDVEMDTLVRRERRRLNHAKEQQASQAHSVDSDEE